MRILRVRLLAPDGAGPALDAFYGDQLGLPAVAGEPHAFRAGETVVEFQPVANGEPFYHFALRVPRNRFDAAREWVANHAELLTEPGSEDPIFRFDNWNADACYVHDPVGNIVELIAHHELPEESGDQRPFTAAELLGVCEVGLVGPDPRAMARALELLGIDLWDGDLDVPGSLAFMGGRDGVLILSIPGRGWLPTRRPAEPHAVEVDVAGSRNAEAILPGTAYRIRTVTAGSRYSARDPVGGLRQGDRVQSDGGGQA